jgi:hypothetical protein
MSANLKLTHHLYEGSSGSPSYHSTKREKGVFYECETRI